MGLFEPIRAGQINLLTAGEKGSGKKPNSNGNRIYAEFARNPKKGKSICRPLWLLAITLVSFHQCHKRRDDNECYEDHQNSANPVSAMETECQHSIHNFCSGFSCPLLDETPQAFHLFRVGRTGWKKGDEGDSPIFKDDYLKIFSLRRASLTNMARLILAGKARFA